MQCLRSFEFEIEPDVKKVVWCSVFVPLSSRSSQTQMNKSRLVFFCCLLVPGSTRKDNAQFWWFKSLVARLLYCNRQWSVLIYSFAMQIVFLIKLLLEPVSETESTSTSTSSSSFRFAPVGNCNTNFPVGGQIGFSLNWLGLMTPRSGDEFV